MTAKATSATPPMMATRAASCGVSVGPPVVVQVHQISRPRRPSGPVSRGGRRRRPSSSGSTASDGRRRRRMSTNTGSADQRVEQHGEHHVPDHQRAHAGSHVEHEGHRGEGHDPAGRGRRAHEHRHQAVARVAHLAEAPHPVAHRGEHQRRRAHRGARGQVEEQAGREAGGASGDAAAVVGHARPRRAPPGRRARRTRRSRSLRTPGGSPRAGAGSPTRMKDEGARITGWSRSARRPARRRGGG